MLAGKGKIWRRFLSFQYHYGTSSNVNFFCRLFESIFTWILQLEPEIITLALFRNLFKYSCWLSLIFSRIIDNLHFIIHVNAIMPEKIKLACKDFNPFQTDVPYLFPLKTSENLWFQEVQKLIIGLKWVEMSTCIRAQYAKNRVLRVDVANEFPWLKFVDYQIKESNHVNC